MFASTHNLPFEMAQWNPLSEHSTFWGNALHKLCPTIFDNVNAFRVGTCHGNYTWDKKSYIIITIINEQKGNGHLQDVFDWFENSCKRDGKTLKVAEIWNENFKKHLIEKRGFTDIGSDWAEKIIK